MQEEKEEELRRFPSLKQMKKEAEESVGEEEEEAIEEIGNFKRCPRDAPIFCYDWDEADIQKGPCIPRHHQCLTNREEYKNKYERSPLVCGDPSLTKSAKEKYIGTLCGSTRSMYRV